MHKILKILILMVILIGCTHKIDQATLKYDDTKINFKDDNPEIIKQHDPKVNPRSEDKPKEKSSSESENKNTSKNEQENKFTNNASVKNESLKEEKKDIITYGDIEFIDETIPYKTLDAKQDHNEDKDTTGILVKGKNGLRRKEKRKVYVNGKYSHTETVKDYYIVLNPKHEQHWIGTKETTPPTKETMTIDNELWILYKTFSSSDACIANIQSLQDQHFREWEGGSMCWGEHLYYSTGD